MYTPIAKHDETLLPKDCAALKELSGWYVWEYDIFVADHTLIQLTSLATYQVAMYLSTTWPMVSDY